MLLDYSSIRNRVNPFLHMAFGDSQTRMNVLNPNFVLEFKSESNWKLRRKNGNVLDTIFTNRRSGVTLEELGEYKGFPLYRITMKRPLIRYGSVISTVFTTKFPLGFKESAQCSADVASQLGLLDKRVENNKLLKDFDRAVYSEELKDLFDNLEPAINKMFADDIATDFYKGLKERIEVNAVTNEDVQRLTTIKSFYQTRTDTLKNLLSLYFRMKIAYSVEYFSDGLLASRAFIKCLDDPLIEGFNNQFEFTHQSRYGSIYLNVRREINVILKATASNFNSTILLSTTGQNDRINELALYQNLSEIAMKIAIIEHDIIQKTNRIKIDKCTLETHSTNEIRSNLLKVISPKSYHGYRVPKEDRAIELRIDDRLKSDQISIWVSLLKLKTELTKRVKESLVEEQNDRGVIPMKSIVDLVGSERIDEFEKELLKDFILRDLGLTAVKIIERESIKKELVLHLIFEKGALIPRTVTWDRGRQFKPVDRPENFEDKWLADEAIIVLRKIHEDINDRRHSDFTLYMKLENDENYVPNLYYDDKRIFGEETWNRYCVGNANNITDLHTVLIGVNFLSAVNNDTNKFIRTYGN